MRRSRRRRASRNASYTIGRPIPRRDDHRLAGPRLDEHQRPGVASFPFHLPNAFRNNLSTSARGEGRRAPADRMKDERSFGWTEVKSVKRLGVGPSARVEEDLTPTLSYLNEDGNTDDRTVMQVRSSSPVAPGGSARRILWSHASHGSVGRAGWVHDYHFIVQWFPKIGVFWKGQWNCHPFYTWTEFFSDFGVYDVTLTLPRGFVVGATGRLESKTDNPDGSESYRFVQEDVHDFAWTASRRFLERRARFEEPGYPPVEIRLLLQPEHAHLGERYLAATKIALRTYGTWSAPIPTPRSPWWILPGARPRAAWSTRRCSQAARRCWRRPSCRALKASRSTRPGTSSGTGSWPTTSSRRPGSTRASTAI
jgi:hypothetical protein